MKLGIFSLQRYSTGRQSGCLLSATRDFMFFYEKIDFKKDGVACKGSVLNKLFKKPK